MAKGDYFMIMSNGHIKEDGGLIEPEVHSVVTSTFGVRNAAKELRSSVDDYTVFKCFPKFEAAFYHVKDFEKESDEGTPLSKYLPK